MCPDKTVPKVQPPDDENISQFTVLQMAGLFRHLGMPDTAVQACLTKKIDGAKLCSLVDDGARTQAELQQEMGLTGNDSFQIYSLKHFVSKSKFGR